MRCAKRHGAYLHSFESNKILVSIVPCSRFLLLLCSYCHLHSFFFPGIPSFVQAVNQKVRVAPSVTTVSKSAHINFIVIAMHKHTAHPRAFVN